MEAKHAEISSNTNVGNSDLSLAASALEGDDATSAITASSGNCLLDSCSTYYYGLQIIEIMS